MNIDMSRMIMANGEQVKVSPVGDKRPDEYGTITNSFLPEIDITCIVAEMATNTLDASSGVYVRTVTYELYMDALTASQHDFVGAIVKRDNGEELIITQRTISRPYAKQIVFIATQRRIDN